MNALIFASVIGAFAGGTDVPEYKRTQKVERWLDEVEDELAKAGLVEHVEPAVVLALIHVESLGDAFARDPKRPRGQFWGLLQEGADVAVLLGHVKRFPKWKTSSYLHGDGRRAIREFLEFLQLSDHNHGYRRDLVAIQWKGGGGTVRTWKRIESKGLNPRNLAPFNDAKKWQVRVPVYLDRFNAAYELWSQVLSEREVNV